MKSKSIRILLLALSVSSQAATWTLDYTAPVVQTSPSAAVESLSGSELPPLLDVGDRTPDVDEGILPGLIRKCSYRKSAMPTLDGRIEVGDSLFLQLFPDVALTINVMEHEPSGLGGYRSFLGAIDGCDDASSVVLLQKGDRLEMDVQDYGRNRLYHVFVAENEVTVEEFDATRIEHGTCATEESCEDAGFPAEPAGDGPDFAPGEDGSPKSVSDNTVDLLLVFDKGAAQWAKGRGGITNLAVRFVQNSNAALRNSGLSGTFKFRLVDVLPVNATVHTVDAALSMLGKSSCSWSSEVRDRRDLCGADVVCFLLDTGSASGTTGLGYTITKSYAGRVSQFSELAYNACAIRSVYNGHTMTHEIGHNMGAHHSEKQDPAPDNEFAAYAHGYYLYGESGHGTTNLTQDGKSYHTIMAYDVNAKDGDMRFAEAPYFSTPLKSFQGVVVGDESAHDNARVLRTTAPYVINFRQRKTTDFCEIFFSPEDGTCFSDTLEVTMTPEVEGTRIRYTLDGSDPTVANGLDYAGPITIDKATTVRARPVFETATGIEIQGFPYSATYGKAELREGVDDDDPRHKWTTDSGAPWVFQMSDTHDGVDAVQSCTAVINEAYEVSGKSSRLYLEASFETPTKMNFWYKTDMYGSRFSVKSSLSADPLFETTSPYSGWRVVEVELPAGDQTITFSFEVGGYAYYQFNGVWIDHVTFSELSAAPSLVPASPAEDDSAAETDQALTFERQMEIRIVNNSKDGLVYYTTDGLEPEAIPENLYRRPFSIAASTIVKAICVEPGKEASPIVSGFYKERHIVPPGEWTTDATGATNSAALCGGRLIVGLSSSKYSPCGVSFWEVANEASFLRWAKANKVYLITTDSTMCIDTTDAAKWFSWARKRLGHSGTIEYPFLVIMDGNDGPLYSAVAREERIIGRHEYDGTSESLIRCLASCLGRSVPAKPTTAAASIVSSFPVTVELAHTNTAGTIYYTTDGTEPTPENGMVYSGPITLTGPDQVVTATVWDDSEISSAFVVVAPKLVGDLLKTKGVAWTSGGDASWRADEQSDRAVCSGELDGNGTSWVQATVTGGGRFKFSIEGYSCSSQNRIRVLKDGAEIWSHGYNYTDGTTKGTNFVLAVPASGSSTYRFEYKVADSTYDYSGCGGRLSNVAWIPPSSENQQPVPESWFKDTGLGSRTSTAAYTALGEQDSDGDGHKNWEEYVLGTDPLDPDSRLECFIDFEYGWPVITWNKTNDLDTISYKVEGSVYLPTSEEDWHEAGYDDQFFRVKVHIDNP